MSDGRGCSTRNETGSGVTRPAGTEGQGGLVYVIPSENMGRGDEELGWALLQNFIMTMVEIKPRPAKIILYNSGVKLVCEESKALEAFRKLEKQGVEILSCGTCIAYYSLSGKLQVGRDTSMPEIMQLMAGADKVVSPL